MCNALISVYCFQPFYLLRVSVSQLAYYMSRMHTPSAHMHLPTPLQARTHTHTHTHTHTQSLSTLTGSPLLTSYHKHWLSYQKGAKFLDNLFSYFNRVPLRKYRPSLDTVDYALPGLLSIPKVTHTYGDTPVEIRQVR